jgi:hypothetical protein
MTGAKRRKSGIYEKWYGKPYEAKGKKEKGG